ncbi:hypothetical protein OF83DRAFT_1180808 [Amylostereum chailletii]|nr:hypothetical protein OF83DRAFT_1180808 [Amylostereum chailletii]
MPAPMPTPNAHTRAPSTPMHLRPKARALSSSPPPSTPPSNLPTPAPSAAAPSTCARPAHAHALSARRRVPSTPAAVPSHLARLFCPCARASTRTRTRTSAPRPQRACPPSQRSPAIPQHACLPHANDGVRACLAPGDTVVRVQRCAFGRRVRVRRPARDSAPTPARALIPPDRSSRPTAHALNPRMPARPQAACACAPSRPTPAPLTPRAVSPPTPTPSTLAPSTSTAARPQ